MEVSRAVRRLSTSRVGIGYSVITPVAGSTRISRSLRQSNAVMVLGVRAGLVEGREENQGGVLSDAARADIQSPDLSAEPLAEPKIRVSIQLNAARPGIRRGREKVDYLAGLRVQQLDVGVRDATPVRESSGVDCRPIAVRFPLVFVPAHCAGLYVQLPLRAVGNAAL